LQVLLLCLQRQPVLACNRCNRHCHAKTPERYVQRRVRAWSIHAEPTSLTCVHTLIPFSACCESQWRACLSVSGNRLSRPRLCHWLSASAPAFALARCVRSRPFPSNLHKALYAFWWIDTDRDNLLTFLSQRATAVKT
jgi:hypothetical protein